MESILGFSFGLLMGLISLLIFDSYIMENNLQWQRIEYKNCLAMGAPQQKCFEKYLVPSVTP